ncbi:PqiC family protein [Methylotuvimicrobium alcaliphilum]|nr:PqiC family protein [Methylotuvimicrobium alcaliphilum]
MGGTTPPSQFYLLEPVNEKESSAIATRAKPVIALGRVRIPRYIDRPQIVVGAGGNTYHLNEFNRWAESLDTNISRVLTQNLSMLVPAEVVDARSSNLARQAKLRISLTILEFHVDQHGHAGLTAQWFISRGQDVIQNRQVSYRLPGSTDDYSTIVVALNECLNRMSHELSISLQQVLQEMRR